MILNPLKIGIIGGGQLGQMMAMSAIEMGYQIIVLDPDQNCPCAHLSSQFICAAYDDAQALKQLNEMCDIITYEFENVPISTLQENISLEKCPQGFKALEISQDRILEKEFAQALNIPTVEFLRIDAVSDLEKVQSTDDYILKTRRLGYDGKGQSHFKANTKVDLNHPSGYILEKKCHFDSELSIAITRFKDGCSFFETSLNTHKKGILAYSINPSKHQNSLIVKAQSYSQKLVEALDYIGVFVVEFFVKGDELFFNEFAPRPHNSYHASIEGYEFSQYDTHILAITSHTSVQPNCLIPTLMVNVLGDNYDKALAFVDSNPYPAHLHLYGKKECRLGRKMGHITYCTKEPETKLKQWEDQLC